MSTVEELTYRNIGQNIRKYRLMRGISQEKLSELLDANSKFVGHVERFERYVGLKKLIKIAQILDIKLQLLFECNN
ncbi:MAG: helix-turn-helix domain-containing protein [Heliobacteriaceae bacterium]|jgi:transcriptional regulator with XRE-family HTH domain|nr:helix-turn-helix domain-containing protein [Heliobacteriaceae bacterium]